ncbi:hypothetical protein AB0D91_17805 [Streptomyces canus]|uniref:hypothetical protein n=1 Tax=Streptomyces canus TaxID=58343 RepID=UPI0033E1D42C
MDVSLAARRSRAAGLGDALGELTHDIQDSLAEGDRGDQDAEDEDGRSDSVRAFAGAGRGR